VRRLARRIARTIPDLLSLDCAGRQGRRDGRFLLGSRFIMSKGKRLSPVSPGEMLLEEFLKPRGISRYRLAKDIGAPA